MKWEHDNGGGSAEKIVAIIGVIVCIVIVALMFLDKFGG